MSTSPAEHPSHRGRSATPPTRTRSRRRAPAAAVAVLASVLVAGVTYSTAAGEEPAAAPGPLAAADFKGVNWAMPGDNFTDGPVVPEGLSESDDYDTAYAKATAIVEGFRRTIGANTVRLPVNADSVPGTAWGDAYAGAVDAAADADFKVILSAWEGGSPNGVIDDMNAFNAMWDAAVGRWESNDNVFFEPMNEPHGYSAADWREVAAGWLADRPSLPKDRVFISGTGYNQDVTGVCADSRFDGTYLSLHLYEFFYSEEKTKDEWVAEFESKIGGCGSRTVLDEFGAPMDDGRDYNQANSGDNFVRYIQAGTDTAREHGMGSVYWPALGGKHTQRPDYDWYSLFALGGSGTDLSLTVRNQSMVDRLHHAWALDN